MKYTIEHREERDLLVKYSNGAYGHPGSKDLIAFILALPQEAREVIVGEFIPPQDLSAVTRELATVTKSRDDLRARLAMIQDIAKP